MHIELLPGTVNVVRFPVERRAKATMELLWEIQPDLDVVHLNADAFGLEVPEMMELEAQTDAETAEWIANQVPPGGPERTVMLGELEQVALDEAVKACLSSSDAWAEVREAERLVKEAQDHGHFAIDVLRGRVCELARKASALMVVAASKAAEVRGVSRAVGIARRGETWAPRDMEAEFELLMSMVPCNRGRR